MTHALAVSTLCHPLIISILLCHDTTKELYLVLFYYFVQYNKYAVQYMANQTWNQNHLEYTEDVFEVYNQS